MPLLHFKDQLPSVSVTKFVPAYEMKQDAALQSVLPSFHVVTGCDAFSQFAGHGKVTACKSLTNNSQSLTRGLYYHTLGKYVLSVYVQILIIVARSH